MPIEKLGFGQMSFWTNVQWTIVRMDDCPHGRLSAWTIVRMDDCPLALCITIVTISIKDNKDVIWLMQYCIMMKRI